MDAVPKSARRESYDLLSPEGSNRSQNIRLYSIMMPVVFEDSLWYRQDKIWDGLDYVGKRNVMDVCLRAETQGSETITLSWPRILPRGDT